MKVIKTFIEGVVIIEPCFFEVSPCFIKVTRPVCLKGRSS